MKDLDDCCVCSQVAYLKECPSCCLKVCDTCYLKRKNCCEGCKND